MLPHNKSGCRWSSCCGPSRCSFLHGEVGDNHPGAVISLNIQYLPDRFMFCMAGSSCLIFFLLIPSPFAPINPHIWPISSAIRPCQSTFFFFFFSSKSVYARNSVSCRAPVPPKPRLVNNNPSTGSEIHHLGGTLCYFWALSRKLYGND